MSSIERYKKQFVAERCTDAVSSEQILRQESGFTLKECVSSIEFARTEVDGAESLAREKHTKTLKA